MTLGSPYRFSISSFALDPPQILCMCLSWSALGSLLTKWVDSLQRIFRLARLSWPAADGSISGHLGKTQFFKIQPHTTQLILPSIKTEQQIVCSFNNIFFVSWLNEQQPEINTLIACQKDTLSIQINFRGILY